jgi:CBS domain-containing protein
MLRVRDIMTATVTTVAPTTTLREAAELFAARHISGAPVVDGGRVVGVVSASDILAFVGSTSTAPADDEGADADDEWDDWEDRPADEAGEETPSRFYAERWPDDGGEAGGERARAGGWDVLDAHTVAEVMTRDVVALPPSAPMTAAAARLRSADVHRALVMDGGALVGIVSTTDLARAVADGRALRRTFVFDTSRVDGDHDAGAF